MTVSIIIPVFKVETYIRRCIQSVMAQETNSCDIECILVDDCTPDSSMSIASEMISSYKGGIRFVTLRHVVNRGLSVARNTGLKAAQGEWVIFVDSDDYLLPQSIQYFLDHLLIHPEVDMIIGNVRSCKDGKLFMPNLQESIFIDDSNEFFARLLHHRIYNFAWNKLIRHSILYDNEVFFIDGILFEDISWSYHLFSHLSSVWLLPKETYVYEYNPTSIVNTLFTIEKADKVVRSYIITCQYLLDNPPSPTKYVRNMTVDYLLFVMDYLMNAVDVFSRCPVSDETMRDCRLVRQRLLLLSFRQGRLLVSFFILLLFPPLSYLQKIKIFRQHYYSLESLVNYVAHMTDFLHKKNIMR